MICNRCDEDKPLDDYYKNRKQCKTCRKAQVSANRFEKWDSKYKEQNGSYRSQAKISAWRANLRSELISSYGGECVCCHETEEDFLVFDHIHGNGNKDRKENRMVGDTLLRHLRDDKPDYIQLLCHNCNWAKFKRGACPHGGC